MINFINVLSARLSIDEHGIMPSLYAFVRLSVCPCVTKSAHHAVAEDLGAELSFLMARLKGEFHKFEAVQQS